MSVEIERRFLIADDAALEDALAEACGERIVQAYVPTADESVVVRVRVATTSSGREARLTLKGPSAGASRLEFEYPVPVEDAERMLAALCLRPPLEKTRHRVPVGGRTWEVDVFAGANAGLVIAEVELEREDARLERPPWVGAEVTGDPRLQNASLQRRPLADWPARERRALLGTLEATR